MFEPLKMKCLCLLVDIYNLCKPGECIRYTKINGIQTANAAHQKKSETGVSRGKALGFLGLSGGSIPLYRPIGTTTTSPT